MIPRRSFLQSSLGAGALAALGDLAFLGQLPRVSAAEVAVDSKIVRFHPEIEPLVRFIEETSADRLLEEMAGRLKRGLSYRDVLTALMLAGIRSIQPRPVGFKFHAVLVINSAHLASVASPESDRWLPIFWALNQFKRSQASNVKEGNWIMPPVDEAAVPAGHLARQALINALDQWDEAAADAAIVGLVRSAGADEIFGLLARYGARDFRDLGHKAIYVANGFRTLGVIGWQHAEPVLRSLVYAMLDRSGAKVNPATADLAEDRPYRQNLETMKQIGEGWLEGKSDGAATQELLRAIRTGSPDETSALVVKLLSRGVATQSLFDGLFNGAGELVMQSPGIRSLHSLTFTNAIHYAWQRVGNDETRRLLLLQNAAFLPLYRGSHQDDGRHIDELEPLAPTAQGDEAITEIMAGKSGDENAAARKMLGYLRDHPDSQALAAAVRRLVFLKGNDAHDYKFSSAVLEDAARLSPPWRDRLLAAGLFQFRGSEAPDNPLVGRIRAALGS